MALEGVNEVKLGNRRAKSGGGLARVVNPKGLEPEQRAQLRIDSEVRLGFGRELTRLSDVLVGNRRAPLDQCEDGQGDCH
jgi:hypothetical protein